MCTLSLFMDYRCAFTHKQQQKYNSFKNISEEEINPNGRRFSSNHDQSTEHKLRVSIRLYCLYRFFSYEDFWQKMLYINKLVMI